MTIREIAEMTAELMIGAMPGEKKRVFINACVRNDILTTYYGMGFSTLTIYKEGFYIEFSGCRCSFSCYMEDHDGELQLKRKPKESKLNKLWSFQWLNEMPKAFESVLYEEVA